MEKSCIEEFSISVIQQTTWVPLQRQPLLPEIFLKTSFLIILINSVQSYAMKLSANKNRQKMKIWSVIFQTLPKLKHC